MKNIYFKKKLENENISANYCYNCKRISRNNQYRFTNKFHIIAL